MSTSVTPDEAHQMMQENKDNPQFKVVDVRTALERCISYIPDTQHVPSSDIEDRLGEFDKDTKYVMVCRSGARSQNATNTLRKSGINAINMTGGMNNWNHETSSSCQMI